MNEREKKERFVRDVETRTEEFARTWNQRPDVRAKLESYDHLVQPKAAQIDGEHSKDAA
jgi:hypothetical protein